MIRLDLGLLGTGKTTQQFQVAKKQNRFVLYTPLRGEVYGKGGHPELAGVPIIFKDNEENLSKGWEFYFNLSRGFYLTCEGDSTAFFKAAQKLVNCWLVLDDFPSLVQDVEEKQLVKRFLPLCAYRSINLLVSGHLPSDIPYKFRNVPDEIYWHGPLTDDYSAKALYGLRRIDLSFKDFSLKLEKQSKFEVFRIR